jgi:cyclic di-GMP phosphodiesterase
LVAPEHAEDPQFEYGFLLHDVGKLKVPDEVLNKPGALTEAEWEIMRRHPGEGRSILEGVDFLGVAREIVYSHHERWDGKGYPQGLRGMEIPLGARIFPLCDAFDAMTSDRPYRKAMRVQEALARVRAGAGTQFWDEAVDAFLSIPVADLEAISPYDKGGS